jgi:hypothetical protein
MATMVLMGEKENKVKVMAISQLRNLCAALQVFLGQSNNFLYFYLANLLRPNFTRGPPGEPGYPGEVGEVGESREEFYNFRGEPGIPGVVGDPGTLKYNSEAIIINLLIKQKGTTDYPVFPATEETQVLKAHLA